MSTLGALCTVCVFTLIAGCDSEDPWFTTVTYKNNSSEAVHLFGDGEKVGPGNKVEPGGTRSHRHTLNTTNYTDNTGTLRVKAYRNGVAIGSKEVHIPKYAETFVVSYPW